MTDIPKSPKGYWVCEWCRIFGNIDLKKAYRPDSEKPVITNDKEKICQQCAKTYWEERTKANEGK